MSEEVKILLIEDNPNDVQLTLHAFKENHVADYVQVVRDGSEAINLIFGKHRNTILSQLKLIVLDLKLPKVNGSQLLSKLKSDSQTRKIPIVVLSSSCEEQDLINCYALGVNSYIVKPINFEQFVDALKWLASYWLNLNQIPA